jgi:hypothetical protein
MYTPEQELIGGSTIYEEPLSSDESRVQGDYCMGRKRPRPLNMDDFSDIYQFQEIEVDKTEIKKIKEQFDFKDKTERSAMLESLIPQMINEHNWFGPDCKAVIASEYDDIKNHTDIVLLFKSGKKYLKLGLDVTTSIEPSELEKKTSFNEKDIEKNKLPQLKYFAFPEEPQTKGRVQLAGRVVVGINKEEMGDLCSVINKDLPNVSKNYLQIIFLEEIEHQLAYFIAYASKKSNLSEKEPVIKEKLKAIEKIREIIEIKKKRFKNNKIEAPSAMRESGIYKYFMSL